MSPHHSRRELRGESGAVAIMMTILAALLLITGALAVDLGNAWARQRDMQTQADVAALSAANWGRDQTPVMWPADTGPEQAAITQKAAEYIVKDNNNAIGMTKTTTAAVVTALTDGDKTNGDIEFFDSGKQMRLRPPPATVNFGMATVFGYSSVDVTAPATVKLMSELPPQDVVPLWIPDTCSFGAVEADTTGGLKGGGSGSGANKSKTTDFLLVGGASPASAAKESSLDLTIKVTSNTALALDASKRPVVSFELTIGTETWKYDITGTWTDTPNGNNKEWTLTVPIGPNDVTAVAGTWSFQVGANDGAVNSDAGTFLVTGTNPPVDPGIGCLGQDRGNFGQLDSPRSGYPGNDTGQRNKRLFANMLNGLDHQLVTHPNATQPSCTSLPLSKNDDVVRYGNNCIVGDTGNNGPQFAEALIGGSAPGRLDVSKGATYNSATSGCPGRSNRTMDGKVLNDDILDCFLMKKPDGTRYTAADVASPTVTRDMLDPAIVNSPRFVWIPVVKATDRSVKDFQPIIRFVPGLVTSQNLTPPTASADAYDAATGFQNGLKCNGAGGNCSSLSAIRIFTFNPRAVPNLADSPVVDYDPTIGREVVKLVE